MEVFGQLLATAVLPHGKELLELFHSHLCENLSLQKSVDTSLDRTRNKSGYGGKERNVRLRPESKSGSPGM
jgi:hypothetical protein